MSTTRASASSIRMLLPLILLILAAAAAAVVAYGTNPNLVQYAHGLDIIMLSRRAQWPLVALCLVLCLWILVLVISGKRRAWWLIGLGPVLALFGHRFATSAQNFFSVVENPPLQSAEEATSLRDEDYVVGLTVDDEAYAFPFTALYSTPVVVQTNRDKRLMLIWSPFANRAIAYSADRDLRARELDIVSMPGNATLIYNSRLGEFINGVTGLTPKGERPRGLHAPIPTTKTTWKVWRSQNPTTRVMAMSGRIAPGTPSEAVLPLYPLPKSVSIAAPVETRITLIATTQPAAVPTDQIITTAPLNVVAAKLPLLLFRDPTTHLIHAFDRRLEEDLMPRFAPNRNAKWKDVAFVDIDTNTGWTAAGLAVEGDHARKGQKLRPIEVEEDLYWGVMKFWYPQLTLVQADKIAPATAPSVTEDPTTAPHGHRSPRSRTPRG